MVAGRMYEPIWKYDRRTLASDLTAHLVHVSAVQPSFHRLWSDKANRM